MEAFGVVFWLALWGVAIWYAQVLGTRRGRSNCWLWGVVLGWLGVGIVALMGKKHSAYDEVAELERQNQVLRLQKEQRELQES